MGVTMGFCFPPLPPPLPPMQWNVVRLSRSAQSRREEALMSRWWVHPVYARNKRRSFRRLTKTRKRPMWENDAQKKTKWKADRKKMHSFAFGRCKLQFRTKNNASNAMSKAMAFKLRRFQSRMRLVVCPFRWLTNPLRVIEMALWRLIF